MGTKFARQVDIVKQSELQFPIIVVGAGGIGSWATLALAKMGCTHITVIDFDNETEKDNWFLSLVTNLDGKF